MGLPSGVDGHAGRRRRAAVPAPASWRVRRFVGHGDVSLADRHRQASMGPGPVCGCDDDQNGSVEQGRQRGAALGIPRRRLARRGRGTALSPACPPAGPHGRDEGHRGPARALCRAPWCETGRLRPNPREFRAGSMRCGMPSRRSPSARPISTGRRSRSPNRRPRHRQATRPPTPPRPPRRSPPHLRRCSPRMPRRNCRCARPRPSALRRRARRPGSRRASPPVRATQGASCRPKCRKPSRASPATSATPSTPPTHARRSRHSARRSARSAASRGRDRQRPVERRCARPHRRTDAGDARSLEIVHGAVRPLRRAGASGRIPRDAARPAGDRARTVRFGSSGFRRHDGGGPGPAGRLQSRRFHGGAGDPARRHDGSHRTRARRAWPVRSHRGAEPAGRGHPRLAPLPARPNRDRPRVPWKRSSATCRTASATPATRPRTSTSSRPRCATPPPGSTALPRVWTSAASGLSKRSSRASASGSIARKRA